MEEIYNIIQENPEIFAWASGIINALWIGFTYFNRQRHERKLENLKNSLKLESDRRLKVFELKASQYEAYVTNLDAFGKKHQVDLPLRMKPIIDKYVADYLDATGTGNKEQEIKVITWFNSQIEMLMHEASEDYYRIQSESNKLKLTATDEMVKEFERLESLIKQAMDDSNEFMGNFTQMILSQDSKQVEEFQERAKSIGEGIKDSSRNLLNLMRAELNTI